MVLERKEKHDRDQLGCLWFLPELIVVTLRRSMDSDSNNMDVSTIASPSILKGPRPTRLKIGGPSHKIKKPPLEQDPTEKRRLRYFNHQQREPVIIYSVSPKAIRTNPDEFMSVVQRLTGLNSSPSTVARAAVTGVYPFSPVGIQSPGACQQLSPAAKLATVERAQQQTTISRPPQFQDELNWEMAPPSNMMGILSPNPCSLPGFSENLFPMPPELNSLGFLQDMMTFSHPLMENLIFQSPTIHSPNWDVFSAPSYTPDI